ncbi:glycoside hydrolase/deacetylase [Auriculariales sp. MPI-PUGE-AT-0066]|nr:glycoside hydrolase/deacetylase [Auriculariales sp. MPI-PUGE-AT-0066]
MVRCAALGAALAAVTLVSAHGHGAHRHHNRHPIPSPVVARAPGDPTITPAPGAMALNKISPNEPSPATSTLPVTQAGAKPSGIPNAPALPDISNWDGVSKYPTWDKVPSTTSPQVIEWIDEVRNSGVVIPDIKPHIVTGSGDCQAAANVPRVNNDTECWWTCGHCTRNTDVVDCKSAKNWGSTFDDGPSDYTNELLLYLEQAKIKSTFFVVGSRVAQRPKTVQTQYLLGHNVAIHTWSHTALTSQSTEQIIAEFGWSKKVIKDVLGVTPLYIRPPYGDIDDRVRAIAKAMNLTVVIWSVTGTQQAPISFDSFDFDVAAGEKTAAEGVAQFQSLLGTASTYANGFTVLEHDLFWPQVKLAVGYYLPGALQAGFKITSVNECMSVSNADAYSETSSVKTLPGGSGQGKDMTGTGQTAPPNAALGGSDGSNTDPNVKAGEDPETTGDQGGAAVLLDIGSAKLVLAVLLASLVAFVPGAL